MIRYFAFPVTAHMEPSTAIPFDGIAVSQAEMEQDVTNVMQKALSYMNYLEQGDEKT